MHTKRPSHASVGNSVVGPAIPRGTERSLGSGMNGLPDAATTPNIHTVIRTLAIALLALALIALVPGRLLFRPWHVRLRWPRLC